MEVALRCEGRVTLPNETNIRKSSKGREGGGVVIFNTKIYIADFGNFKQGFLSMKLIQKSNFGVQGMFFPTIVLRKIKIRHTLKKALLIPYTIYPS